MTDLPTLKAALKLADQDSPLPSLAGPALKVLRAHIREAHKEMFSMLVDLAGVGGGCAKRGNFVANVDMSMDEVTGVLAWYHGDYLHVLESRVLDTRLPPNASLDVRRDSATLTALIAELRQRETVGRAKYGTDVDRTDLTNPQWRQHLREELMDALLYSLAEERTNGASHDR